MICPKCLSFRPSSHLFCEHDGTPMRVHQCACGNNLTAHQQFCERCGAPAPKFEAKVIPFSGPIAECGRTAAGLLESYGVGHD